MTSRSNAAPGRFGLLDIVVLIAMAVTATAFAAGLIINSGIDTMTGVIAAAALFVVMASSHYVITRQARSASVAGRMDELEEALVVLDGDLQRIDQVEDDVARLDLLTDRVERLDQAVSEYTWRRAGVSVRAPACRSPDRRMSSSCADASTRSAPISPQEARTQRDRDRRRAEIAGRPDQGSVAGADGGIACLRRRGGRG